MTLSPDDVQACLIGLVQALIAKGVITMDEWKQFYTDGVRQARPSIDECSVTLDEFFNDGIDDVNVMDQRNDE